MVAKGQQIRWLEKVGVGLNSSQVARGNLASSDAESARFCHSGRLSPTTRTHAAGSSVLSVPFIASGVSSSNPERFDSLESTTPSAA